MEFSEQYGPWALIAGASEGLGAAFGDECARRGCNVVLVARRESLLDETAARLRDAYGVETRTVVADLARADIGDVLSKATDDLAVGLFVYNAAFAPQGRFVDVPLDDHLRGVAMNVTTPTVLSHLFGRAMVDRGRGGIVLVSSGAAHAGMKVFTTYAAGKAYELILGEGLWDELREHGVDALAYVVGATATPTFMKSSEHDAVTATGARTPEQVAAQLFEVLGATPRGYSHPGDEDRTSAAAGQPRTEVVAAVGEMISAIWH
jgi:short-subunit dehydrogenase